MLREDLEIPLRRCTAGWTLHMELVWQRVINCGTCDCHLWRAEQKYTRLTSTIGFTLGSIVVELGGVGFKRTSSRSKTSESVRYGRNKTIGDATSKAKSVNNRSSNITGETPLEEQSWENKFNWKQKIICKRMMWNRNLVSKFATPKKNNHSWSQIVLPEQWLVDTARLVAQPKMLNESRTN